MNRRPRLQIVAPGASAEEAAAVVAAIERFMRDTTPPVASGPSPANPWARAARLEATGHAPGEAHPWSPR